MKSSGAAGGSSPSPARKMSSSVDAAAWRASLKPGMECDAQDQYKTWFEGVIVDGPDADDNFLVHFKGWHASFDETIPAPTGDEGADRIKPQWTEIGDWRSQMQTGETIDINLEGTTMWCVGEVQKVDFKARKAIVMSLPGATHGNSHNFEGPTAEFDLSSENIMPRYTHIKLHMPPGHLMLTASRVAKEQGPKPDDGTPPANGIGGGGFDGGDGFRSTPQQQGLGSFASPGGASSFGD
eukprot:g5886.t1